MFKQILSPRINDSYVNLSLLILRLTVAVLMGHHGYGKLMGYSELKEKFISFMGMSPGISLGLTIFAEFFCSILLGLGLLTRFALVPLMITMLVALCVAHNCDILGEGESAFLYFMVYLTLFISGPGKYSGDQYLVRN